MSECRESVVIEHVVIVTKKMKFRVLHRDGYNAFTGGVVEDSIDCKECRVMTSPKER